MVAWKSPSCADIMFMSCLQVVKLYKIEIKSDKINNYFERAVKRDPIYKSYDRKLWTANIRKVYIRKSKKI